MLVRQWLELNNALFDGICIAFVLEIIKANDFFDENENSPVCPKTGFREIRPKSLPSCCLAIFSWQIVPKICQIMVELKTKVIHAQLNQTKSFLFISSTCREFIEKQLFRIFDWWFETTFWQQTLDELFKNYQLVVLRPMN